MGEEGGGGGPTFCALISSLEMLPPPRGHAAWELAHSSFPRDLAPALSPEEGH